MKHWLSYQLVKEHDRIKRETQIIDGIFFLFLSMAFAFLAGIIAVSNFPDYVLLKQLVFIVFGALPTFVFGIFAYVNLRRIK